MSFQSAGRLRGSRSIRKNSIRNSIIRMTSRRDRWKPPHRWAKQCDLFGTQEYAKAEALARQLLIGCAKHAGSTRPACARLAGAG